MCVFVWTICNPENLIADVGDLYQSSEMDKRIGVMYGSPGYLPPDMEFWDGEGNFDKVIKDIIKNFKSAGLTHIFCNKDPEKKPGKYMSVWIDTIRIKGNHAKIMLAFEKWYTRLRKDYTLLRVGNKKITRY